MTIRIRPLHACDHPKCRDAALHRITFTTHRGELDGPKVCTRHINWGRAQAKRMEDS